MKKQITVLLLICCLIFSAVPVFAGAATGQQISANHVSVTAGSSATVTLKAENFEDIAALDVYVFYDANALTVSGTYNGSMLSGAQVSVNTAEAGQVSLSMISLNGISGNGNLLSIYFEAKANCAPGTYPITVAIGDAYHEDQSAATLRGVNGSVTVEENVETESFHIYSYFDTYTAQKDDVLSYHVENSGCRPFVSGEFTVTYDYELFAFDSAALSPEIAVEGAVFSVNSSVLGQVRIAYGNVDPVSCYELFTVKLKVIADINASSTISTQASNMYREDLSPYLPYNTNQQVILEKAPAAIDYPNAFFRTDRLVVGKQCVSHFCLEAGSGVGAADFTLTYDPTLLRCVSVNMTEDVSEKGGMVVINDNYTNGVIKFSYLNTSAYDEIDLPLVQIVWEPIRSSTAHYRFTSTAVGVVDAQMHTLHLEHVADTGCIYVATFIEPTCKTEGRISYLCACGDAPEDEVIPTIDEEDCTHYTVTFQNDDGTTISSKEYHLGEKVEIPANPTKAADNTYTYTFACWSDDVAASCAGDVTYTATYTSTYKNYTVVFKNWDGTVLSSETYHWGDPVTAPANPTKAADNIYTYTFAGWDNDVVNCAGDVTYTATYTPAYINYTVVFKNWNGDVLSTETYHWGEEIVVPADPTKAADNTYIYSFAGWDKEVIACAGDVTYTATYTPTYINYTVVFKNWNGDVLSTKTYHWGDTVFAPSAPTRPADSEYIYTFTGWDKTVTVCAGNATYTAVFAAKSPIPDSITSSKHTIRDGVISNIGTGTTAATLIGNLNEGEYVKILQGDTVVSNDAMVGTGMIACIMDGDAVKAAVTIVATGDTNGDGKITITDMLAVKAHLLAKSALEGVHAQAADTNGDSGISITDFIQMKAHILGKSTVQPQSAVASIQLLNAAPAARSVVSTTEVTVAPATYTLTYDQPQRKKTRVAL